MKSDQNGSLDYGRSIASALARKTRGIDAGLLYGSSARGKTGESSDIDLIVVTGNRHRSWDALRHLVKDLPGANRLQLQALTHQEMRDLFGSRPDFAAHLVSEGIVLYDKKGFLAELFATPIRRINSRDFDRLISRAERQAKFDRFNGQLLFSLARLYAIGKAAVILSLVRRGKPEFDRHQAFEAFKTSNARLRTDVDQITRLEPFYLHVRRGARGRLPFDPSSSDAVQAAKLAVRSVKRIAAIG
jgi:predicted nucleotidyltransferase